MYMVNMEIKEILDSLNEYYKTRPYLGLPDYDPGPPPLSKMEKCVYFGILKSLSHEQLNEAREIISEGGYDPIIDFFLQATITPQVKDVVVKNANIDTVIDRFLNKRSKRVVESRKELLSRFDQQSFSDQKKIVKAFMSSNCPSDVEWAAKQADKLWNKSYADYLKDAFQRKPTEKLALTIIHHMPLDYVVAMESQLVMFSRAEFCIRRADQADALIQKYSLNIFESLYVKARTKSTMNLTDLQVEYRFFKFIFLFCQKVQLGIFGGYDTVGSIPWIRRVLWALGELGYRDILMQFLKMNRFARDKSIEETQHGELYYTQQWIIENYFPAAAITEDIDFSTVNDGIDRYNSPQKIKLSTTDDLGLYDDLPPDVLDTLIDFM